MHLEFLKNIKFKVEKETFGIACVLLLTFLYHL